MKLTILSLLVLLSLVSLCLTQDNIVPAGAKLAKNQLSAYPNTYHNPTMSGQIPDANYKAPLLSHSLFEKDPTRKLRKGDFIDQVKYPMYHLTRGEMEQIFIFADANKDDLLEEKEWDDFSMLYVYPFESCDASKNYLIDDAEFKTCWDADPKSKLVTFRRRHEETKWGLLMDVVTTRQKQEINFSDYLVLRKALFGWSQCQSSSKYMAVSAFKCAFRLAVPSKYHLKLSVEEIYKTGINIANDKSLIELDYLSYVRIIYFSYVFSIYNTPQDSAFLEKSQFIKSVREDRFPLNWEESEIDYLYQLIEVNPFKKLNVMNFQTFSFFFNLHRLFNKYSIVKPLQLAKEELLKLLDDPLSPYGITLAIDLSKTKLPESAYLEASMVLQRERVNEKGFFYGFKEKLTQDASANTAALHDPATKDAKYYQWKANPEARDVFFTMMTNSDKEHWTKEIYYRSFVSANLFTSLCFDKRWIVPVPDFLEKLHVQYDTVNPPISQRMRNSYVFYKFLPGDDWMDLLAFMALENWNFKIELFAKPNNEMIIESILKMVLKDYGMENMPDTVIDLAQKGEDPLRRRLFEIREVLKNILIVHISAAEHLRDLGYAKDYKLKLNNDDSRKYPTQLRRQESSPLV